MEPLEPAEFSTTGSERQVLAGCLESYRGIVAGKLAGLSDEAARRSLVPSPTTLLGLIKHLASVEREWFGQVLGHPAGVDRRRHRLRPGALG